MRTDVKLGVIFALILVLAGGGYFAFRGGDQTPIPIADGNGKSPSASPIKPKTTTPPQGPNSSSNPVRPNPASRDATTGGNRTPSGLTGQPRPVGSTAPGNASPATTSTTAPAGTGTPAGMSSTTPTTVPIPTSPLSEPSPSVAQERTANPTPVAGANPVAPDNTLAKPTPSVGGPGSPTMTPLTSSPTPRTDQPVDPKPAVAAQSPSVTAPPVTSTPSATTADRRPSSSADASKAAVETHRVQPGDSLSSLAQAYYGDQKFASVLADANPELTNPNVLRLGSLVKIPPLPTNAFNRGEASAAPRTSDTTVVARTSDGKRYYTVKSGDSFYSIARTQLGNAARWKELLSLNDTLVRGDPTALQPGQKVVLPES